MRSAQPFGPEAPVAVGRSPGRCLFPSGTCAVPGTVPGTDLLESGFMFQGPLNMTHNLNIINISLVHVAWVLRL